MRENGNTIKEKGSCHNLDTLETTIRMLLDVTNITSIEPLRSLSQSKERYKALKIKSKITYNWEF